MTRNGISIAEGSSSPSTASAERSWVLGTHLSADKKVPKYVNLA